MEGSILYSVAFTLIGYLIPAYASFRALECKSTEKMDHWLAYWIIISMFSIITVITDVFKSIIPFYPLIKLAIITWLALPSTQGAYKIYSAVFEPLLINHSESIQDIINKLFDYITSKLSILYNKFLEKLPELISYGAQHMKAPEPEEKETHE
ncbi:hypothetical protein WA158_000491 [Blastocystis sp. Blastoise]